MCHMPDGTYTRGESHYDYFGFRNPADNKTIIDDGAMNTVVRDWTSSLESEKKYSPLSALCNTTLPRNSLVASLAYSFCPITVVIAVMKGDSLWAITTTMMTTTYHLPFYKIS
jgi:hypothetical protein